MTKGFSECLRCPECGHIANMYDDYSIFGALDHINFDDVTFYEDTWCCSNCGKENKFIAKEVKNIKLNFIVIN